MNELYRAYRQSFALLSSAEGLSFLQLVAPLLAQAELRALQGYRHHKHTNRLHHVIRVAYLSYVLAKKKGYDEVTAARGALLHDLFYYDDEQGDKPAHAYRTHPRMALKNAERLLPLSDAERDIILHHMWPLTAGAPQTKEGRLVCLADKYCSLLERVHIRQRKTLSDTHQMKGQINDRDRETEADTKLFDHCAH